MKIEPARRRLFRRAGIVAGQLASAVPGSCVVAANPTTIFNLATFPGAPAGVYDAYVKQSLFPSCFANGLPASEARMLAAYEGDCQLVKEPLLVAIDFTDIKLAQSTLLAS